MRNRLQRWRRHRIQAARLESSRLSAGREALAAGKYADAALLLEGYLAPAPAAAQPRVHRELLTALRRVGRLDAAADAAERAMAAYPRQGILAHEAGRIEVQRGNATQGVHLLHRARALYGDPMPWRLYRDLAAALRRAHQSTEAERVARDGFRAHPEQAEIAHEWARACIQTHAFETAAFHFATAASLYGDAAPVRLFLEYSRALRHIGELSQAEELIASGVRIHPNEKELLAEWARQAVRRGARADAADRFERVLSVSPAPITRQLVGAAASAFRKAGHLDRARATLEEGLGRFPDAPEILLERARVSAAGGSPHAATRFARALAAYGASPPIKALIESCEALFVSGDVAACEELLRRGRSLHPHNAEVHLALTSITATRGDIAGVIEHLSDWCEQDDHEPGLADSAINLAAPWVPPLRDETLERIAEEIAAGTISADEAEPAMKRLVRHAASLFDRSGRADLAIALYEKTQVAEEAGQARHQLLSMMAGQRLASKLGVAQVGPRAGGNSEVDASDPTSTVHQEEVLDAAVATWSSQRSLQVIDIPRGSELEVAARSRLLTPELVQQIIRHLSQVQAWPEIRDVGHLGNARDLANRFAIEYAESIGVPEGPLADAVQPVILREIDVIEPLARVAEHVLEQMGDRAILVPFSTTTLRYLQPPGDELRPWYLAIELLRRGGRVALCRFTDSAQAELSVRLRPGGAGLVEPLVEQHDSKTGVPREALVASSMRQWSWLLEQLDEPLVMQVGHIVSPFSHSRQRQHGRSLRFNATIAPSRSLLPTIDLDFEAVTRLPATASPSGEDDWATLRRSSPLSIDFGEWLQRLLGSYLAAAWRNAQRCAEEHQLSAVHSCDAMTTLGTLIESAVKARGGRVELWPHSSNPNLPGLRRPGTLDVVHAATAAGQRLWEEHHEGIRTVRTPYAVLPHEVAPSARSSSDPVSIVVLGTSAQRLMRPILHQDRHEELYLELFSAFEQLVADGTHKLFYKAKDRVHDNRWLYRLVGSTPGWSAVEDHPLTIDLPNPVFVSVSFGSTALLEGGLRGIPGFTVADPWTSDYLALRPGTFPRAQPQHIARLIADLAHESSYAERVRDQTIALTQELGEPPLSVALHATSLASK